MVLEKSKFSQWALFEANNAVAEPWHAHAFALMKSERKPLQQSGTRSRSPNSKLAQWSLHEFTEQGCGITSTREHKPETDARALGVPATVRAWA